MSRFQKIDAPIAIENASVAQVEEMEPDGVVMGVLVIGVLSGMALAAGMLLVGFGLMTSFFGYVSGAMATILLLAIRIDRAEGRAGNDDIG